MLARGEVHDPKIGFITLTRVQVSPDLQVARVYYTSLGDPAARKDTQKALDRATPFLRRQIGSRVQLRRVPEIEFRFDESIANQDRIEQILRDLHQEEARAAAPPARPPRMLPARPPLLPMTTTSTDTTLAQVADAIRARRRFVVVSHARPDGDAIGSQVAMALALRALGKDVRMVAHDPAPQQMQDFPGVADIQLVDHLDDTGDAVIFMECGDVRRPGRGRARQGLRHQHRPPPRQRDVRGDELHRPHRGRLRRDRVRPDRRARRAAERRDGDARLSRHPHRHRRLPLLAHLAPHLRHLPPLRRGRARSHRGVARHLRPQQPRTRAHLGCGAQRHAALPRRPRRDAADGPGAGRALRRHLRRHRRADQLSAHREGHRGGGLLQGERARRLAHQHAVEGRR